ncbi:transglycosylase family protein [Cumulibacter manganitolerans]|uniref:transglycosylase family protein n=1 Tax=Cumulibacter manganitolerans TaxID=1884992 RepID=UPI002B1F2FC1|nr:transglycosylase family protein [Cumulibacter manganitolerans]
MPSWTPAAAVRRGSRKLFAVATLGAAVVVGIPALLPGSTAVADPSSDQWLALRKCESSNNYSINTGNGYYGAYQFDLATWRSVGGSGYPHQASPSEQDARALMLYRMRGWQPWECASILGFGNDADARSGVTGDISIGGAASNQSSTSDNPGYQGQLSYGQSSAAIKVWQQQMAARGAGVPATGYFGPLTQALVLEVQRQNGLEQVGFIGPQTWAAAFTGTYNGQSASGTTTASSSAPGYPGQLRKGVYSEALRQWQAQMVAKGAPLSSTGYFGPNTAAVVLAVQAQNGLEQVGYIGPLTWAAAWSGSYHA